jgi:TDG/mug DNA glycosylase family protein
MTRSTTPRPTREERLASVHKLVPDVIAPGLRVLFCGINPGLYSSATGYHFAGPGNRFWPALHAAGFTERVLAPHEWPLLLERGCGITNVVARASATAAELSPAELAEGGRLLEAKVRRFQPRVLAVLGVGAYRTAFGVRDAALGRQPTSLGDTLVWVVPNPSGLNAHETVDSLAVAYAAAARAAGVID